MGFTREIVTCWRNDNPHFAQLNRQRRLIWGNSHDRLMALASKAVDNLEVALQNSDARAAVEVLKAVGLYGQLPPPSGPEDAELVLWSRAVAWAELELGRRGPSPDPTLNLIIRDSEVARLAHERREELR